MKKSNSNSGKVIAVILILLFFGVNFFKSENEGGPQEKQFAKAKQTKELDRKFDNNLAKSHNIDKLKFAYTGKWEKNDLTKNVQNGKYAFTTPENTRGQLQPTAAAKKTADKKKKKTAKIVKKSTKFAKKYGKRKGFDSAYDNENGNSSPFPNSAYYSKPVPQERTPSDEEKEKKLSAKEWIEQILLTNSVEEFVTKYKERKVVGQGLFYGVVEELLSSDQENSKKLGFQALERTPSSMSLVKYVQHIDDEMSATLKAYAQGTLDSYYQPRYLRVLNSSLNSENNKLKILSATIIKSITTTVLQSQTNSGENVVYTAAQIENFKTMLNQSLTVITNALKTALEAEVLATFTSAQSILTEFLS